VAEKEEKLETVGAEGFAPWARLFHWPRNRRGFFEHTPGCGALEGCKVCTCGLVLELQKVYKPHNYLETWLVDHADYAESLRRLKALQEIG